MQRNLTRAFIAADEDAVVLERRTRTANGSGGYVLSAPAALPSQPMRLIPLQSGAAERHTLDGKLVEPGYALLADWDADMARWDLFTVNGRRYEVVFINENRSYELKGEVVYHGE
jgi:hypothetical protein